MNVRADCPVLAYAQAVLAGEIVAGKLVRLACARHVRDLETGGERGLVWDQDAADFAVEFYERFLCLNGGEFEGRPFLLEPWQKFVIGSLFGWKGQDGYRRFRTAYIEIAKGNGKSPLVAGVGLKCEVADDEPRAEVYSAATKKEQAQILFRDAVAMVKLSPLLRKKVELTGGEGREWNIAHLPSGSFFRAISSGDGQSGPRPHCALIDEVHEHKDGETINLMRAGTKSRRQALIVEITNSGFDRHSICWQHHEYSQKILERRLENDAWFAYVCQLDVCAKCEEEGKTSPTEGCPSCDNWRDEAVWIKANPNLGVSVPLKYLREQVREADGMPAKEAIVKRLNFCIWTESRTAWLPAAVWEKSNKPVNAEGLRRRPCWAGLDIANRFDLNALVFVFHNPDEEPPEVRPPGATPAQPALPAPDEMPVAITKTRGVYRLLPYFWIPRECARAREEADKVPYRLWHEQGWLEFTEGDIADLNLIQAFIERQSEVYDIRGLAYDPHNATQMAVGLQAHGVRVVEFYQNLGSFNEPSKEFECLVRLGRMLHGGHPVLAWNASNVEVYTAPSGDIRPVKPQHGGAKKIDGIVAAIMGLGVCMQDTAAGDGEWNGSITD